jgi:hypothetical protein
MMDGSIAVPSGLHANQDITVKGDTDAVRAFRQQVPEAAEKIAEIAIQTPRAAGAYQKTRLA